MNNRHPQGKHNTGSVRGATPEENRWYANRAEEREAARSFTAASGMVPSNPRNFYAAKARPSEFRYDAIADGLAVYGNPYGDGRRFVRGEEPVLTTPKAAAGMIAAAPPAPGAEAQPSTPGYGFGADSPLAKIDAAQQLQPAQPLGTSTSPSMTSNGPRRDVPRPA